MTPMKPDKEPDMLPCPFCGSSKIRVMPNKDNATLVNIRCSKCGVFMTAQSDEVTQKWNGRVTNRETSDGYHTFNELYEHRHALFAVLCSVMPSWKSLLHSDGTMFDGWFIAGIDTVQGQITYHLPIRLWGFYNIKELPNAPAWDGHTSDDVVNRLLLLSTLPATIQGDIANAITTLEDGCLWVDEMQVGVNKWAGDAVGLLARQDNLNAWKKQAQEALTRLMAHGG